jgi:hypothetical protein
MPQAPRRQFLLAPHIHPRAAFLRDAVGRAPFAIHFLICYLFGTFFGGLTYAINVCFVSSGFWGMFIAIHFLICYLFGTFFGGFDLCN